MGKCVRCGIEGPFVRVDEQGLCALCRRKAPPPKKRELWRELDPQAVFARYLTTSHSTYPSKYHVVEYYTAEFNCMLSSLPETPVTRRLCDAPPLPAECVYVRSFDGCAMNDLANFVAVDTETSSLGTAAEIVEVSAVRFEGFRPVAVYGTLCKPYRPIAPSATAIHGISDRDVAYAPRFAEILPDLYDFCGTLPLVAHNAPFDLRMLASEGFDTHGRQVFDTLPIARRVLRDPYGNKLPSYKLADSCRACAILFDGAHSSTADAMAAGMLFLELIKRQFRTDDLLQGKN